jgi:hypothetical protein
VDGSGTGYLRTVCDYVHLNPSRAKLLGAEERLLSYPWSSLVSYLSTPKHRPAWMRTDRLFGGHGIRQDNAAGRAQFESNLEQRRQAEEADDEEWKPLRRGWCLGGEKFKEKLLEMMAGQLGEHQAGDLKRESAEARAERIIAEELRRLRWTSADLNLRLKSDPAKLQIAARLRAETTLPIHWIAKRLHLGTWKSANARIHAWKKTQGKEAANAMV